MSLTYRVSGFRSLRDTQFRLDPGLNVLVGPNGSGKTNISSLIDFVSSFVQEGAHLAIAKAGGSSRVFSNELLSDSSQKPLLSIQVDGDFLYGEPEGLFTRKMKRENVPATFTYCLLLSLNPVSFDVEIDRESLTINVASSKYSDAFNQETTASGTDKSLNASNLELSEDTQYLEMFSEKFRKVLKSGDKRQKPLSVKERLYWNAVEHYSIFRPAIGAQNFAAMQILSILSFRRTINIDPQKVREPEDIASDRVLKADGSGVIGRLYSVIGESSRPNNSEGTPAASKVFKRIVSDLKGVNKQVQELAIDPNMETGKFNCSFTVKGTSSKILRLPLAAVSDGTAKWLAMVTAIRTDAHSLSIEEPENYLHPSAQKILIKTLRDVTKTREDVIFLLTTHSETIINAVNPEELRLCEYRGLTTRVRELENPMKISNAINKTGFGLGFLYAQERM